MRRLGKKALSAVWLTLSVLLLLLLLAGCGHKHSYEETVVEPTCTEGGYTVHTCSECGDTYRDTETDATGHAWGADTAVWTWSENNTATLTLSCTREGCNAKSEPMQGKITRTVTVPPTCLSAGRAEYSAAVEWNGETLRAPSVKSETLPATGHTPTADPAVPATCTATGLTAGVHCSVCRMILTEQQVIPMTAHTPVTDPAVPATCTKTGLTAGTHCSGCQMILTEQTVIPMIAHTPVTDPAVAATCTKSGLTAGTHCSGCQMILTEQTVVPMIAHTPVTDPAVAATCTESGLTAGTHCSACHTVLTEQQVIPVIAHTPVTDPAVAATCTESGLTEGMHCSVCHTVLTAQTEVASLGHLPDPDTAVWTWGNGPVAKVCFTCHRGTCRETVERQATVQGTVVQEATCTGNGIVRYSAIYGESDWVLTAPTTYDEVTAPVPHTVATDAAIPATCTATGMTEGTHCSVCGKVLTAQTVIPASGHRVTADPAVPATCTVTGLTEGSHCAVCQTVFVARKTIPALGHTAVTDLRVEPSCTVSGRTEGSHCSVCRETLVGQKTIPATGHTPAEKAKVEPDCVHTGCTAGSYCTVCGAALSGQTELPALGHDFSENTLYCRHLCGEINPDYIAIGNSTDLIFSLGGAPDRLYYLTCDINLQGQSWDPIGEFKGVLNGNGYRIFNFMLSRNSYSGNFGFFGMNSGRIENLRLEDFTMNMTDIRNATAGALVGRNTGAIYQCSTSDCSASFATDVLGVSYQLSAFVGKNEGTIDRCFSSSAMEFVSDKWASDGGGSNLDFGGLVGRNTGLISDSHSEGTIYTKVYREFKYSGNGIGYYAHVGGLAGIVETSGEVRNSYSSYQIRFNGTTAHFGYLCEEIGVLVGYNSGKLVSCYTSGAGKITLDSAGNDGNVGGLLGRNGGDGTVDTCYSLATVESVGSQARTGGFVGSNRGTVRSCFSTGTVQATNGSGWTGGFAGVNDSSGTLFKNYSTGNITSKCGMGFFVCSNSGTAMKNCFLNTVIAIRNGVVLDSVNDANAAGLPYDRLFSQEFLIGELAWDQSGWLIAIDDSPMIKTEYDNEHKFDDHIYEPTCEKDGFTISICNDCRKVVIHDHKAALGHDWSQKYAKEATCVEIGYIHEVCTHCHTERDRETARELGHQQGETVDRKAPTCLEAGHYVYRCTRCGDTYEGGDIPATGHTGTLAEHITAATCTSAGSDKMSCTVCGETYTVTVPETGHQYVNLPAEERQHELHLVYTVNENGEQIVDQENSFCDAKDGITSGRVCEICGDVRLGRVEMPAHTWELIEEQAATCQAGGYRKYECSECSQSGYHVYKTETLEPIPHVDLNLNYRCDKCDTWLLTDFDETLFMEIRTAEDLRNISQDPGGYYKLMADIDLTDEVWTPIGTEAKPFTGVFFGNGFKIKGLRFISSPEQPIGGLFGYSKGTILGVTLDGFYLQAYQDVGCTFGGIVAYNDGTVKDCSLIGTGQLDLIMTLVVTDYEYRVKEWQFRLGGIVGVNVERGLLYNCAVNGSIQANFVTYCAIKSDKYSVIKSNGTNNDYSYFEKISAQSILHISFGGIVGQNQGKVMNCCVTGQTTINQAAIATLTEAIGNVSATMELYAGSLIGVNSGTVTDCQAVEAVYRELPRLSVKLMIEEKLDGHVHVVERIYGSVLTFVNSILNDLCAGRIYTAEAKIVNHSRSAIVGVIGDIVNEGTAEGIISVSSK